MLENWPARPRAHEEKSFGRLLSGRATFIAAIFAFYRDAMQSELGCGITFRFNPRIPASNWLATPIADSKSRLPFHRQDRARE
jgi:hypothetical protein